MSMDISRAYLKKFKKSSRSTFSYWYYHWKAFNLLALSLGVWKVKYLFHDIEKPWLKLFWPYDKVQRWHRSHNRHHADYKGGLEKVDWEALILDNECSRYTKLDAPMTAREYVEYVINKREGVSEELRKAYIDNCPKILNKLRL